MSQDGARVRFPPPLVFLVGILAGVGLRYAVEPAPAPIHPILRILAAAVFIGIALALLLSARILFVRTGQSPVPWKPTPELIFQVPYRFPRNPMYVGLTLFQVGLGLALNNLWISLW